MNVALGFVILLLIGFSASRLTLFRERFSLGTQYLFFAGTEFLIIGLLAGPTVSNVLNQDALRQLSPVLSLCLGWIGLLIGLQFDHKVIARIPLRIWIVGVIISLITFVVCFGFIISSIPWFFDLFGREFIPKRTLSQGRYAGIPDLAFLLGCIAAVSTYSALALLKRSTDAKGDMTKLLQLLTDVRSPIAVLVMGIWYCFNHPTSIRIDVIKEATVTQASTAGIDAVNTISAPIVNVMSGFEWLILTLLLGYILGWLLHYLTNHRLGKNEMLLLMTGAVIFSGGLSSYLRLSPLFVNMIMGITLANLPNFACSRIISRMLETEKPFFVIFMILAGAMWPPITPTVLLLAMVYCIARLGGFWLGSWIAVDYFLKPVQRTKGRLGLAMLPQGGVALALAVDFALIHPEGIGEMALGIVILAVLLQQLIGPYLLTSVLKSYGDLKPRKNVANQNGSSTNPRQTTEEPVL